MKSHDSPKSRLLILCLITQFSHDESSCIMRHCDAGDGLVVISSTISIVPPVDFAVLMKAFL